MRWMLGLTMSVLLLSCNSRTGMDDQAVEVKEVIQVEQYTYLLVEKEGKKGQFWIAGPSMEAHPGERYSYQGGLEMTGFYSSELDRTFDRILFVDVLYSKDDMSGESTPGSRAPAEKAEVGIAAAEGTTAISDLFAHPKKYEGKVIRVSGQVTKFNPAIMERNWVHLQDGTEFEGKFDLTATTSEYFEKGDVITLEGVLVLDQDFGYGYTYERLLEQARAVTRETAAK